jgi:hypothetical protein
MKRAQYLLMGKPDLLMKSITVEAIERFTNRTHVIETLPTDI